MRWRTWMRAGPAGVSWPISRQESARAPGSISISTLRSEVPNTASLAIPLARTAVAAAAAESETSAASSASAFLNP